ncbi:MAG: alternate-type signal peptide domain-containing protein [Terrimesophilobacter sp.]
MNKLTKSAIAGAAGIALLLGGAGSLAYWNSSATVSSTTIDAGSLSVAIASGAAWDKTITKWVPGDTATYSANLTVVASGDNIKADLTLDKSSIASGTLASALDIVFATGTLPSGVTNSGSGVYRVAGAGTYTIPVTVTVTFPFGSTADNSTQSGTVNFTGVKFTVTQAA